MTKEFSPFLEKNRETLKKIVNSLKRKFSYVSILGCDVEGEVIKVTDKEVSVCDSSWQERGFVIRVFNGKFYSEYSFNSIPSVKAIVDKVSESCEVDDLLDKAIYVKPSSYEKIEDFSDSGNYSKMELDEEVPLNEIIKDLKKTISNAMEENEYIIAAEMSIEHVKTSKIFISNKKELSQVYAWSGGKYRCVVNKDNATKSNSESVSSMSLKETVKELKKKVANANKGATALLDAKHVKPGEYECITTPKITGLIAHEAFGHGVEMDMFVKNRAIAQDYIGKEVASSLVNMHEGAIPLNDVSSYFFDDEGNRASDTLEIKNGVLVTGIVDQLAALKLNVKPTGNGKRSNYKRKVYTRMTTTYFEKGHSKLDDMIKSIDYGFLIESSLFGMEDPKNWGIQCSCLIGWEIKNGELTGKAFSPITITGYVPTVLKSISMISNEFETNGAGFCGKGYKEWVKTSIGGPHLKVKVNLG